MTTTARDPWDVLELEHGASAAEIKAAYRRLARRYHPDLRPDDPQAIDHFLEVGRAYQALSSAEERAEEAAEDESPTLTVAVPFAYAYDGGQLAVELPVVVSCPRCGGVGCKRCQDGKTSVTAPFDVAVPQGAVEGMQLTAVERGGRHRQLPVVADIQPSPIFKRAQGQQQDLVVDLPVTFTEATLGATVAAPTPTEIVQLKIPPATADGKVFRLQGRGMPILGQPGQFGNLIIRVRLAIPKDLNPGVRRALEDLARYEGDPRLELMRGLGTGHNGKPNSKPNGKR